MGDEEMRTEDLISHPNKIIEKKVEKQQIFDAFMLFFLEFSIQPKTGPQSSSPHSSINYF
jgi:hypothetical protein